MNYSLKVSDKVKESIKRAICMVESHYQKLGFEHKLREIMKVEGDVGKLCYTTFALAFRPELEFQLRNSRRRYRIAQPLIRAFSTKLTSPNVKHVEIEILQGTSGRY